MFRHGFNVETICYMFLAESDEPLLLQRSMWYCHIWRPVLCDELHCQA